MMMWLINTLNGWKSIVGWAIMQVSELIMQHYPDFPHSEFVVLARWLGELLLGVGLIHKVDKAFVKKG